MFNPLEKEKYHLRIPFYWYLIGIGILLIPFISHGATYGSNFLTGGTCTASAYYSEDYNCSKAFDTNLATRWDSNATTPANLRYDLGSGITKKLSKWSINKKYDVTAVLGKNINILGSNDDSTWTSIGTSTLANTASDKDIIEFELTTSSINSYRYYKFNFLDSWGGTTASAWEISAYECTDCDVATSTTSSTISSYNFMSPELDQLLIYILEGLIVIGVAFGTYKILK